ncbi:TatD family hydrolase [Opitutales bacterium]|nr:TatD family hydrolase [Opitutales bacterium]MDA8990870.1 TatD family hydrolase [Opitutales bacterium]
MSFIDSHCHLKSFHDELALDQTLGKASTVGVDQMITVGTNTDDWDLYENLSIIYAGKVFYTVGIHPCYVDKSWAAQSKMIKAFWTRESKPVALGEIGLDYFRLPKDKNASKDIISLQIKCFNEQLKIAKSLDCPIVVHSRDSFEDCLSYIDKSGVNWNKVVFHCFSEGKERMQQIIDRGGTASFTGNITYGKNKHLHEAIKLQGIDNLMLETDSPYLTPEPNRRDRNEPSSIPKIAQFISNILGISENDVERIIYSRTKTFFNII